MISGFEPNRKVENITIENLTIHDQKIETIDDAKLRLNYTEMVEIR